MAIINECLFFETIFLALLALASLSDIKRFHILNIYPISLSVTFVIYAIISNDITLSIFLGRLALSLAILSLGFVLWLCHFWGAGDAKLFASSVLWVGFHKILGFVLVSMIALGFIAFVYWLLNVYKNGFKKTNYANVKGTKIPCAVSFFFGALFVTFFS